MRLENAVRGTAASASSTMLISRRQRISKVMGSKTAMTLLLQATVGQVDPQETVTVYRHPCVLSDDHGRLPLFDDGRTGEGRPWEQGVPIVDSMTDHLTLESRVGESFSLDGLIERRVFGDGELRQAEGSDGEAGPDAEVDDLHGGLRVGPAVERLVDRFEPPPYLQRVEGAEIALGQFPETLHQLPERVHDTPLERKIEQAAHGKEHRPQPCGQRGPRIGATGDGVEAALARATPAEEGNFTSVSMPAHVMHALLEMAADGIALLDTEGNIISFSAGAERLFGLSSEDARGRPFRDLLASESRPALEMHLKVLQAADAGHELRREQQCDVLALGKGGGKVPLCLILGRLPRNEEADDGKAGNVDARALFCVAMHDITRFRQRERELERAREEAERHSARKSEFLARISHELRTPLNAILGFAEVLRQEMFGELGHEKYRAYAHDIQKSGELLLSLVNDLLDLARIESGRYELRPEEVNLGAVLEDTVSLLRDQISATGVEVRRVVPDNLPKVVADARSMKQILINLLSNAIKFSGHNGRVVVALRQCPDGGLELAVKDSGPGMSREELREALEPYCRVSRTGDGKPGTGLGLPLAKALAEANKARFEIDSEPGQGTEVRVIFPPHRVLA